MQKLRTKTLVASYLSLFISITYIVVFYLMFNKQEVIILNYLVFTLNLCAIIYEFIILKSKEINKTDIRVIQFSIFSYITTMLSIFYVIIEPSSISIFIFIFSILLILSSVLFNTLMYLDVKKNN